MHIHHNPVAGRSLLVALIVGAMTLTAAPARAAGLLVADNGFGGVLQITQQDVRVTINNGVAVTEIDQVFRNTENRIVEALYTFPVPRQASVSNFSMWINGKEMVGEVVEKQKARQVYESYKQTKRDPGLLEQVDYKRFEMRVFPIAAGAEQRVRLTYAQELDFDHDTATYVYPLATLASAKGDQKTHGRFSFSLEAKSEVPIVDMKSPSHPDAFALAKHVPTLWQASLETKDGDLSRDLVVVYQMERPKTGIDLIASRHDSEDGYFLLTLTAGKELEGTTGGSDYVFVLDVSGSMASEGKLSLSRGSIEKFLQGLDKADAFEVISFNISAQTMFNEIKPVTPEAMAKAVEFLRSRRAMGGTVLRPALEAAYRYKRNDRPLNVIVLSDGLTEPADQAQLVELMRRKPTGVTMFCVGVGNEINRPLLSQLATDAGGLALFLSADDDFERQAQSFRRKLTKPAAANVKLTFAGGDVYDIEPATLPNLYHGQPVRVFGRYRKPGQVQVALTAEVQGSPLEQRVELTLPGSEAANSQVDRMWAVRKMHRLMDEDRQVGSQGNVPEIVRLCEGYSIVSEYASFLVLENDAEYQRWQIQRRNATRIQRDRAARETLRAQLDKLKQQSAETVGPAPSIKQVVANNTPVPTTVAPRPNPSFTAPPQSRPSTFNFPSVGGGGGRGGALDPVTVLMGVGLATAALVAQRRRKQPPTM